MIAVELDRLIKQARSYLALIVPGMDPQVATLLHRYMCVLISSNIDKAMQLILSEYARTHGSTQLNRFVSKRHARGRNFNTQLIVETLSLFDAAWGHAYERKATATDLKDKIDSIYGIRNSIAHGEQYNITRPSLDGYFDAHVRAIALIRTIVLG